jgi:hypothetical protein
MRIFAFLCIACLLTPSHAQQSNGFSVSVECCDVLQHIHKYLVDKPTDRISTETCRKNTKECVSYNLIKTFVKHTKVMLDPYNKQSPSRVEVKDGSLVFVLSNETMDVVSMSIFAFMGRSVATDASMKSVTKWVSYDVQKDKFYMEDTVCEINKDVYTTLLLTSIILLIFFIDIQVQRDEARKYQDNFQIVNDTDVTAHLLPSSKPNTNMQLLFRKINKV